MFPLTFGGDVVGQITRNRSFTVASGNKSSGISFAYCVRHRKLSLAPTESTRVSALGACVLAPGLGEGGYILRNVKATSKITAVHDALTLTAATPGKRVLLNMDDSFKLSVYCIGQDPCKEYRCLAAAGLSPTEVPHRYLRASLVQGHRYQAPGCSNKFSSLKVLVSLLLK